MPKPFITELNRTLKTKNIVLHEFSYSKSCNKTSTNFPEIYYQFKASPFGEALIMNTKMGLCGLAFCDQFGKDTSVTDMKLRWPEASFIKDEIYSDKDFKSIFSQSKPIELCLIGSKFQIEVWKTLLKIPSGKVISYMTLAKHIRKPKAVRAIATAIGKNPLCWLIPCHRVLRTSGELGGYHWGLQVKRNMLAYEAPAH
jgi:AraC family transcriptional regulator of adaptative response/methylated-DNA-[protein]-cysteine methyltransferase